MGQCKTARPRAWRAGFALVGPAFASCKPLIFFGLTCMQILTAHIDEDEFCRYVIQRDINGIALALRETHKDDFFQRPRG